MEVLGSKTEAQMSISNMIACQALFSYTNALVVTHVQHRIAVNSSQVQDIFPSATHVAQSTARSGRLHIAHNFSIGFRSGEFPA